MHNIDSANFALSEPQWLTNECYFKIQTKQGPDSGALLLAQSISIRAR